MTNARLRREPSNATAIVTCRGMWAEVKSSPGADVDWSPRRGACQLDQDWFNAMPVNSDRRLMVDAVFATVGSNVMVITRDLSYNARLSARAQWSPPVVWSTVEW